MSNKGSTDRYDDLFPDQGEEHDETSFPPMPIKGKVGGSHHVTPAAATSTTSRQLETFDTAGDDPSDVRRPHPPSNITLDFITAKLNASNYYPDVRFDWCTGLEGRRLRFSRRYIDPHVLVDVFNNDTRAVRQEVARKRQILLAHNEKMEELWIEHEEELANPTSRIAYVSRGFVVMGYLPILSARVASAPFPDARAGVVCSLPEPLIPTDLDQGTQMGMRVINW